jgi:RimJ/RimL family protein N-acetyltransferase
MDLQPLLEDEVIIARPLHPDNFEALYTVASDRELWAQHPNKDRYKRPVFETFFEGALQSGGAYIVYDKATDEAIGSTRFYDFNEQERSVLIGYTFYAKKYWGKGYNHRMKRLMLQHAFQYVDRVIFHIGATNYPSQRSIERLGAVKVGEQQVEYYGEAPKLNFVYEIKTNPAS